MGELRLGQCDFPGCAADASSYYSTSVKGPLNTVLEVQHVQRCDSHKVVTEPPVKNESETEKVDG